MKATVQARLDEETQAALDRLVRRHGWSVSKVVRDGIRLVEQLHGNQWRPKIVGLGMFDSGTPDMGTNKKYMEDFGMNSGIDARPRSKRKAG
jgi:Ribbon-helix-helix protein, copG family